MLYVILAGNFSVLQLFVELILMNIFPPQPQIFTEDTIASSPPLTD